MQKQDIEHFFKSGKSVAIGIPSDGWNRPFYFYGIITEIEDKFLVIRHRNGLKKILFSEIEDIHFSSGGHK